MSNTVPDVSLSDETREQVVAKLNQLGWNATHEYPGVVCVTSNEGDIAVHTGMHGWDYYTPAKLVDDRWEPIEDDGIPDPSPAAEFETDPGKIAAGWAQHLPAIITGLRDIVRA